MDPLKINDNSTIVKSAFLPIRNLTNKIANRTLGQLEHEGVFIFPKYIKDAEDITKDQMIIQSYNDSYRTSNIMGFLGYGDERLIIQSRFCRDNEDFLFQYLLAKVLDDPNIIDLLSNADQNVQLFNFLLFLFPFYLKAAMRKGLYKKYVRIRYNDNNVKGTIDIARQIVNNTPFIGKIAYSQREFSYDNFLMELVRHTIELIKSEKLGNRILVNVTEEINLVIKATPQYKPFDKQKIIDANKKNTVRHAYFREYLALQRLCLLILQHQRHHIGFGSNHVYGLIFDGAWIWEEYINSIIGDSFYHPKNKSGFGVQRLFNNNDKKTGKIYPDFISHNSESRKIIDAKYKPVDNIGNKDYLQVLAYMFRFDAKAGYYIYPNSTGESDMQFLLNKGSTFEGNESPREDISVTKLGFEIPVCAKDYEDFRSKMEKSESEIYRKIFG